MNYELSNAMKRYINSYDSGGGYQVNDSKLVINRKIACTKTTREGNTRADASDYISKELNTEENVTGMDLTKYRIRKLTPRECFRLQGVKNADFDRISKDISNSSLYHLAGDSISTNSLIYLFGALFGKDTKQAMGELIADITEKK